MQTLKTAAIVVLVMTVMYGMYVSLTTPPETLPPDVADLLVIDDDLAIDAELPDSLGELNINEGDGLAANAGVQNALAAGAGGLDIGTGTPADAPSFGGSFAPAGTNATITDNAVSMTNNVVPTSVGAVNKLPAVTGAAAPVSADPTQNYPSTGNRFDLPDPSSGLAGFSPDVGSRFSGTNDAMTNLGNVTAPPSADGQNAIAASTTATDSLAPPDSQNNSVAQASASSLASKENLGLKNAIMTADRQYASDQKKEALATLSLFYSTPNIPPQQRVQLLSRLDPLAREVIYSKRHLLEQPHRVGQNETLMEIAERYEVPWQLLANINGVRDPVTVLPGTELKVVRGPFNAQVDLGRNELALFLGDLYAGRFPIAIGNDPAPNPGTFTVQDKQSSHTFYDRAGAPVPAGSPQNPYGNAWLDLGGQLCIHGSPNTMKPSTSGCISLAGDHADDLLGILSRGSSVTIRR